MSNFQEMSGPDFLDAVAQQSTCNGLDVNAAEFSRRADQWKECNRALDLSQAAVGALQRAAANQRRNAAHAYDLLSRVRPASESFEDYETVRITLSAIGDVRYGPTSWADQLDSFGRNPRSMPMPGDRFYLPVQVHCSLYRGDELEITYIPMLRNERGELEPKANMFFSLQGYPTWPHGAIGVVSAPQLAFEAGRQTPPVLTAAAA